MAKLAEHGKDPAKKVVISAVSRVFEYFKALLDGPILSRRLWPASFAIRKSEKNEKKMQITLGELHENCYSHS
jgi:hypothetical protein